LVLEWTRFAFELPSVELDTEHSHLQLHVLNYLMALVSSIYYRLHCSLRT